MLDAPEPAAHDQRRDQDCRHGHARIAADACELRRRSDPGELGASGADVGHEQDRCRRGGRAMAVAVADQPRQPATGDAAHPRAELVEDDERDGRQQEHPEQAIAEVGAEDRVRRDAGRVVVREAGEHSRPDDGGKSDHPRVPAGGQRQRVPDRASASDGTHSASLRFAPRPTALSQVQPCSRLDLAHFDA